MCIGVVIVFRPTRTIIIIELCREVKTAGGAINARLRYPSAVIVKIGIILLCFGFFRRVFYDFLSYRTRAYITVHVVVNEIHFDFDARLY